MFLVPILVVSALFLVFNLNRVFTHDAIDAQIVELIRETGAEGDPVYKPVYEYQVDGRIYRYTSAVSLGGALVPDVGDRRTLLYDPNNPSNARVRNYFTLLLLPAVGVAIPLLVLGLMIWAALRRRRQPAAIPIQIADAPEPPWAPPVADRTTIEATFMGAEPSQMDAHGRVRYRVRAQAEIDDEIRRFVGPWVDEDPTLLFMERGNTVEVKIDPQNPGSYEVVMPAAE